MNNLTLGDGTFGYYETLCGGAGAGDGEPGASVVHTHMTNTRMTDAEVLERRCPILVRQTRVRRGSGGKGRFPGGDGLIRRLEARVPLTVSLLSERRVRAPFGLEGGGDAARGGAAVIRADGSREELPGRFTIELQPGDAIEIATPGGGGYGTPGG
jgi:5-oxoprolinase (ATP-hydrolysing)